MADPENKTQTTDHHDDVVLVVAFRIGSGEVHESLQKALSLFVEGYAKGVAVVDAKPMTARSYDEYAQRVFTTDNLERESRPRVVGGADECSDTRAEQLGIQTRYEVQT